MTSRFQHGKIGVALPNTDKTSQNKKQITEIIEIHISSPILPDKKVQIYCAFPSKIIESVRDISLRMGAGGLLNWAKFHLTFC